MAKRRRKKRTAMRGASIRCDFEWIFGFLRKLLRKQRRKSKFVLKMIFIACLNANFCFFTVPSDSDLFPALFKWNFGIFRKIWSENSGKVLGKDKIHPKEVLGQWESQNCRKRALRWEEKRKICFRKLWKQWRSQTCL